MACMIPFPGLNQLKNWAVGPNGWLGRCTRGRQVHDGGEFCCAAHKLSSCDHTIAQYIAEFRAPSALSATMREYDFHTWSKIVKYWLGSEFKSILTPSLVLWPKIKEKQCKSIQLLWKQIRSVSQLLCTSSSIPGVNWSGTCYLDLIVSRLTIFQTQQLQTAIIQQRHGDHQYLWTLPLITINTEAEDNLDFQIYVSRRHW